MAKQKLGYIYRKFGNTRYRIGQWYGTKREAQSAAKRHRASGIPTRITSRQGKWVTWLRVD